MSRKNATRVGNEARELAARENDPEAGEFSAQWRAAIDGAQYRFDHVARRTCLHELRHPEWVAIAQTLAGRGRDDVAKAWALEAPDLVSRDACFAVIASQWGSREAAGA